MEQLYHQMPNIAVYLFVKFLSKVLKTRTKSRQISFLLYNSLSCIMINLTVCPAGDNHSNDLPLILYNYSYVFLMVELLNRLRHICIKNGVIVPMIIACWTNLNFSTIVNEISNLYCIQYHRIDGILKLYSRTRLVRTRVKMYYRIICTFL